MSRDALIQKTQEERRKREQQRRQTRAATVIQATVRSWTARHRFAISLRSEFDVITNRLDKTIPDANELTEQAIQYLLFFHNARIDHDRLNRISWHVIQCNRSFFEHVAKQVQKDSTKSNQWLWRFSRLLHLHFQQIDSCFSSANNQSNAATGLLRLVQLLTDAETYKDWNQVGCSSNQCLQYVWQYLLSRSYFAHIRQLIDVRLPPLYETTLHSTAAAHAVYELAVRPLQLPDASNEYTRLVVGSVFRILLGPPLNSQLQHFVLPMLTNEMPTLLRAQHFLPALRTNIPSWSSNTTDFDLPYTPHSLYAFVHLLIPQLPQMSIELKSMYLFAVTRLIGCLPATRRFSNDYDSDDDDMANDNHGQFGRLSETPGEESLRVGQAIRDLLNATSHVTALLQLCCKQSTPLINPSSTASNAPDELLHALAMLGYHLLLTDDLEVHRHRLLYTLAFNGMFLRRMWSYVTTIRSASDTETGTPLLQLISLATPITPNDWPRILPQLTLFCALFTYLLPTSDDIEFYEEKPLSERQTSTMPFTLEELCSMVVTLRDLCLGLIELAYRDTKPLTDEYRAAINPDVSSSLSSAHHQTDEHSSNQWLALFKVSIQLLRQLHVRDSRQAFCAPSDWISNKVHIAIDKPVNFKVSEQQKQRYQPFVGLKKLSKVQLEELGPPMSINEIRHITILQEMPFLIPFTDRVQILRLLINRDKEQAHGNAHFFLLSHSIISVTIRRNYLYEDAFEKLSFENQPDIKKHVRVQMVNEIGLDEAGIDGGGIFREFLSQLLKTAFDPNRGFFRTSHDNFLYPNASADQLHENYQQHFYFIGRMLGKAIYENMLTELPFSLFFLAKILDRQQTCNIDIHHLASFDPLMYKNLLYLKNYEGDVAALELDFTVAEDELGSRRTVELKPNGANITVTSANRIEYIHLMADYRLNRQIRPHCTAFKRGMANVLDLDWLRMFGPRELRVLIGGAQTPIDLDDLAANCVYSGGYSEQHATILVFWSIVRSFDETHKRKLLKFVTSCSRPPLLGFAQLQPPFTIQCAGRGDRLPTASTCMNLLKLPEFTDANLLRQKLIYAIEAEGGFELS